MIKEGFNKLKIYIVFFYIYAFLGWLIDVSIVFVSDGVLENRGFLYEPICPMYGFAALVLVLLAQRLNGKGSVIKRLILATLFNIINIRSMLWYKMVGLLKATIQYPR